LGCQYIFAGKMPQCGRYRWVPLNINGPHYGNKLELSIMAGLYLSYSLTGSPVPLFAHSLSFAMTSVEPLNIKHTDADSSMFAENSTVADGGREWHCFAMIQALFCLRLVLYPGTPFAFDNQG
jgi:hypothetical protein